MPGLCADCVGLAGLRICKYNSRTLFDQYIFPHFFPVNPFPLYTSLSLRLLLYQRRYLARNLFCGQYAKDSSRILKYLYAPFFNIFDDCVLFSGGVELQYSPRDFFNVKRIFIESNTDPSIVSALQHFTQPSLSPRANESPDSKIHR